MKFVNLFFTFCISIALSSQNNIHKLIISEDKSTIILIPQIDREDLFKKDSVSSINNQPLCTAISFPLNFDASTAGVWTTKNNGLTIWRVKIKANDASGLFISFSDFYIPQGGKLYIYNGENDNYPEIYTAENNTSSGKFILSIDSGDEVVLEYESSSQNKDNPRFIFSELLYNLKDENGNFVFPGKKIKKMPKSSDCMPNIICPEGNNWKKQKRGVMKLLVTRQNGAVHLCTGSLINNTKNDKTPYILTASHCFDYPEGVARIEKTKFIFDYESRNCDLNTGSQSKIIEGAEMLVFSRLNGGSDGTLLKMTEKIPSSYQVYFNGWQITNNPATIHSGAIIHHPSGVVKKISLFNSPPRTSWWNQEYETAMQNAHFEVGYSKGVTEGGSSGAPMFNQDGLIVASLTGGLSSCDKPWNRDDYGKLFYHWNKDLNANNHMKKYLDSGNTGLTALRGINYDYNPNVDSARTAFVTIDWEVDKIEVTSKTKIQKITVASNNGFNISYDTNIDSYFKYIQTEKWVKGVYIIVVECDKDIKKSFKVYKK